MAVSELLPQTLPSDPMPLFAAWFAHARERRLQPNPDAMVLATVADGQPSARVVLCKRIAPEDGYLVFFTNYLSRKGRELAAHPRAAVVFHWDALHRQVRIEGRIVRSPAEESDAYFASRPLDSRIGACLPTPRARRTATCRARRIGAAFGSGSKRSSCGSKAPIACTTAPCGDVRSRRAMNIRS
jgi:pyridoxamine 5'-phosphate oxidase